MGTSFDIRRGSLSGRIRPASFRPAAGDYAFALGAEAAVGVGDPMVPGDYVEVRQTLDLTDVDLVGATLDAVGRALDPFVGPSGWPLEPGTIFSFPFHESALGGANAVPGGFNLSCVDPSFVVDHESYSPDCYHCRRRPVDLPPLFPDGLRGVLTPQPLPPVLPQYTLQWWMDFDADGFSTSNAKITSVPRIGDDLNGGEIHLMLWGTAGPGAHSWRFYLRHGFAPWNSTGRIFPFLIEHTTGWHQYSLTYDAAQLPGAQVLLYEDDALVAAAPGPSMPPPIAPIPGSNVWMLESAWLGRWSSMRLLPTARSAAQVATDRLACVTPAVVTGRWTMAILVDGAPIVERTVAATERRRWTDFAAPTRRYPGVHDVAFRLTLKEAA
jgi:hypothetical protein